jgi:hypothetical protein
MLHLRIRNVTIPITRFNYLAFTEKNMTDKNKQDIYTLEQNLIEELNDNKEEILEATYPEDLVNDYANSWVPIYNYDLLSVAQSDLTLGYTHESDIGEGDVYQQLTWSIHERLMSVGYQWLNNQVEVVQ